MASVQTEQPLTSVAAFALALVEASSRLTETSDTSSIGVDSTGDADGLPLAGSDDALASAE